MNTIISDIDLSKKISENIHQDYKTAIEFIQTNPDYSLTKFRKILESVVSEIANKNDLKLESKKLIDNINFLFDCQLINTPQKSNLHEVRRLGNEGVHPPFKGDFEYDYYKLITEKLILKANDARKLVVSVLEDVFCILNGKLTSGYEIEIKTVSIQNSREIIFDAYLKSCWGTKLKAGIISEGLFYEQHFKVPSYKATDFDPHLVNLKHMALSFYEASCVISSKVDDKLRSIESSEEIENIICKTANLESLSRYGELAFSIKEYQEKALKRIEASADRGYGQAAALYGGILYDDEQFELALKYLAIAEQQDVPRALRFLFYAYSEGIVFPKNIEKALAFLDRAIELGCIECLAELGEVFRKGELVKKDNIKAKKFLDQSIEKGSYFGKYYLDKIKIEKIKTNLIENADKFLKNADAQYKLLKNPIKKMRSNELCNCGSGIKYKKCCKNPSIKNDKPEKILESIINYK